MASSESLYSKTSHFIEKDLADYYLETLSTKVRWYPFAISPNSRLVHHWEPDSDPSEVNDIIYSLAGAIQATASPSSASASTQKLSVFLNKYDGGNDYCPYHRDVYGTDVYTVSLGDTRDLLVKPDEKGTRAETIKLEHGDLYYMAQALHRTHRHSIPARKGRQGTRISVVFFM